MTERDVERMLHAIKLQHETEVAAELRQLELWLDTAERFDLSLGALFTFFESAS